MADVAKKIAASLSPMPQGDRLDRLACMLLAVEDDAQRISSVKSVIYRAGWIFGIPDVYIKHRAAVLAQDGRRLATDEELIAAYRQALAERYPDRDEGGNGRVYFLRAETTGRIKIGYSVDVAQRHEDIQAACSERLELLGTIPAGKAREKQLHAHFFDYRCHGEWFNGAILGDVMRLIAEAGKVAA